MSFFNFDSLNDTNTMTIRLSSIITTLLSVACSAHIEPTSQSVSDSCIVANIADSIYNATKISLLKPTDTATDTDFVVLADIVPDIIQEIRYYGTYNFVGCRLPGYDAPIAILTRRAADSLALVSRDVMQQGFRLKVFDAYRPQRAVFYFVGWAHQKSDTLMKQYFYPDIDKADVFRLGYISHCSGHTRGSTIDLTLFDEKSEREVDMGGTYDFFGEISHYNYHSGLTKNQIEHRRILREAMMRHGFKPISTEWWHFSLTNEPYPNTYFDFPITVIK